ncbi:MAG TPA: histidine kinase [Solirubrobacterales bacterium]|nr:histidine kinase [Solirubrobacterales bacterium]
MTSLRRALIGLALLAFGVGLASLALIVTSDHVSPRGLAASLTLVAGWGFAGTGLFAWYRRPGNRTGPLMTAIGFTWFFRGLEASNSDLLFTLGALGLTVPYAILVHLLVAFPSGRLETRTQRALAGIAYFVTIPMQAAWVLFADPAAEGCEGCPDNAFAVGPGSVGEAISAVQALIAIPLIAATVVVVYRRWRRSSASERRALGPVLVTGAVAFLFLLVQLIVGQAGVSDDAELVAFVAGLAAFACLPIAFLVGLLRSRIGRDEEIRSALTAENAQLTAELRATVEELRASRARIVAAGYAERRRVERDLHDGAQQRLVALAMNLRLARKKLDSDPAATAELLDEGLEELAAASSELRELARGIHPAVLSDRGLEAAIAGLAERSPVPVEVLGTPKGRLPESVESASYFVIAEALTNVARYARAEQATVRVAQANGSVEIEVSDDGVGGADPEAGSGLRGLADRVAALEGRLEVNSVAGEGTVVRARIPCG